MSCQASLSAFHSTENSSLNFPKFPVANGTPFSGISSREDNLWSRDLYGKKTAKWCGVQLASWIRTEIFSEISSHYLLRKTCKFLTKRMSNNRNQRYILHTSNKEQGFYRSLLSSVETEFMCASSFWQGEWLCWNRELSSKMSCSHPRKNNSTKESVKIYTDGEE